MTITDPLRSVIKPLLESGKEEDRKAIVQALDQIEDSYSLLEEKFHLAIRDRAAASALLKKTSADLVQRYRALFEHSGIPMVVLSEDGSIILANPFFAELVAVPREEIEGKRNIQDFVDPSLFTRLSEYSARRGNTGPGTPAQCQGKIITASGAVRVVMVNSDLFPGTGECILSLLDITDKVESRRELQENKERLEAVISVYQQDWEGVPRIAYYTLKKAITLTGSRAGTFARAGATPGETGDVVATGWDDLFVQRDSANKFLHAVLASAEVISLNPAGGPNASSTETGSPSQGLRFLTVPILEDGRAVCAVCVAGKSSDYTDSDIFHLNVLFSGMWRVIVRNEQADTIEAANRKLNLLSSVTRHDVRNKLTTLIGYLELIKEVGSGNPAYPVFLEKAILSAHGISDLIEFTHEYQEIGVHSPRWQNVGEIFHRAAATLMESGVHFDIAISDLSVFADPLLEKVFYNLLENAVRHGDHVSHVRVFAQLSGHHCIIVVEDDGAGVPATEKEKIFTLRYGKNTGFGLFLSREVLSMTGLSIAECGTPGSGARFEILVPKGSFRTGVKFRRARSPPSD